MYWSDKRNKKSTGLGGGVSGTLKNGFGKSEPAGRMTEKNPETFKKYI